VQVDGARPGADEVQAEADVRLTAHEVLVGPRRRVANHIARQILDGARILGPDRLSNVSGEARMFPCQKL
jgi:hypothetical protein